MSDWYYSADNAQKGPVNESELKAYFASNKLPGDTLVWKDGMENWTPANQLPGFTFRPPPSPAAIQPDAPSPGPKVVSAGPNVNNPESAKPVDFSKLMGPGEALEVDEEDVEHNRVFGILAYLGPLCLVPVIVAKDSPFSRYHANQGLILFLLEIAMWIVLHIISIFVVMLPAMFGFLIAIFSLIYLGPLALLILGIINAALGKCVPLPVIGGIKLIK
jgi:uncharacterized membrane protein